MEPEPFRRSISSRSTMVSTLKEHTAEPSGPASGLGSRDHRAGLQVGGPAPSDPAAQTPSALTSGTFLFVWKYLEHSFLCRLNAASCPGRGCQSADTQAPTATLTAHGAS